jgi:hypothetical protein
MFPNRQLKWILSNAIIEIKPVFITSRSHVFLTNACQAMILLLFNNHSEMTYLYLREMTDMPDEEIQLGLKFLCCHDNKILKILNKQIPAAF